jgi:hypothetical protein
VNLPTPDALQVALTLTTLAAIWLGWAKVVGPKLKPAWSRLVGTIQAIAGRDPIIDKVTGKEIAPALPPLGEQLSTINDTMAKLVVVIESNHDAHKRIDQVVQRVDGHDQALAILAGAQIEKAALHKENAAFFDMVAKRDSDVIDEPTD